MIEDFPSFDSLFEDDSWQSQRLEGKRRESRINAHETRQEDNLQVITRLVMRGVPLFVSSSIIENDISLPFFLSRRTFVWEPFLS